MAADGVTSSAEDGTLAMLEESTVNARQDQLVTLRTILSRNAGCGYLRRFLPEGSDGAGEIEVEVFRNLVPISTYEDDYAEIVGRIADCEEDPSVLSFDRLLCFFLSSGTSSEKPKMIPYFESAAAKVASGLAHRSTSALLRSLFPTRPSSNKVLWFLYAGNVTNSKGGLKVMPATAFPMQTNQGGSQSPLFSICISPPSVILGADYCQQTYCHLLCGLRFSESIDAIRAPYAAGLVRAMRLLQSKWAQLCDDIESGCVHADITDTTMRESVEELLGGPQPDLARKIRQVCGRVSWDGIIHVLWPEARYVACVSTGSMEQYYTVVKYFAGESISLLGGDYFASECAIGINMDKRCPPGATDYVLIPTAAYFEFLPFDMGKGPTKMDTVDISGVEIGRLYEVVATTYRGLYRYRLGDIVKVVGFHNSSPKLQFVTRAPKRSDEMFTEKDLISAMGSFQEEIVDFAGYFDSDPRHLIIFVELRKEMKAMQEGKTDGYIELASKWNSRIEGCLGGVYMAKRADGDIGPLEVAIVNPGSFDSLAEAAVLAGCPASQYKPQKIIRNQKLVEILKASVNTRH